MGLYPKILRGRAFGSCGVWTNTERGPLPL